MVGVPEAVRAGLKRFVDDHRPDEIILTAQIYDKSKRIRSLEIASHARAALVAAV